MSDVVQAKHVSEWQKTVEHPKQCVRGWQDKSSLHQRTDTQSHESMREEKREHVPNGPCDFTLDFIFNSLKSDFASLLYVVGTCGE